MKRRRNLSWSVSDVARHKQGNWGIYPGEDRNVLGFIPKPAGGDGLHLPGAARDLGNAAAIWNNERWTWEGEITRERIGHPPGWGDDRIRLCEPLSDEF